jgi:hypothetical protein
MLQFFFHQILLRYDDERMKSKLDPTTTPQQKYDTFESGLRRFLTVSKDELTTRESEYQVERSTQKKRGPKPRPSS